MTDERTKGERKKIKFIFGRFENECLWLSLWDLFVEGSVVMLENEVFGESNYAKQKRVYVNPNLHPP